MNDDNDWFAAKRFGYGAGMPIAWQGWALMIAYLTFVFAATFLLRQHPLALAATIVPATIVLLIITARTTRGGWRWRWGSDD